MLLRNHARRRVSSGQDFEMIIADDVAGAGRELESALERVSQRIIAEQLCVLDNSIGLSVSKLVLTKFQLSNPQVNDEAESPFVQTESEWSAPKTPLTLAAAASGEIETVFDIEPEPTTVEPDPHVVEPRLSEVNLGSWD